MGTLLDGKLQMFHRCETLTDRPNQSLTGESVELCQCTHAGDSVMVLRVKTI